jgi:hypothetical protein
VRKVAAQSPVSGVRHDQRIVRAPLTVTSVCQEFRTHRAHSMLAHALSAEAGTPCLETAGVGSESRLQVSSGFVHATPTGC